MFKSKFLTYIAFLLMATTSFLIFPVKNFAATTIFSDNFGSSYVTLASHVPTTTGTGYTLLINNGVLITVQSYNNHATVAANTLNSGSFYTLEGTYPDADYEISSNVTFAGGGSSYTRSMGLRVQDANNMYLLRYGGTTMIMYKRVSGTWTTIGTASGVNLVGNTSSSPYIGETVSFSAVGTTLTAKVDGVTKLTVTDSSITATGKAGIGLGYVNISTDDAGTGIGIDNVVVQTATSDSTAPTITNVSSDKTNGSYKAGEIIDIDVTFSEIVTSTGDVTVTLETGDTDRTCTFTVTSASSGTCNYTVQAGDTSSDLTVSSISGTIADAASNAMSNFVPTTNLAANKALVIDTTDPTVQSFTPVDNETNFSPTSVFLMTFNQAVDVETGNITIKKTSDDSTVETISVSGGLVTGTGTTVITIDPSTNLSDLTQYYILVDATAFDDAAGNSYAGIVDTTSWSFTTGDTGAPAVSSLSPLDGATNVELDTNLVITFDEIVDVETGNIVVYKSADNSVVATIPVADAQITGTGTTIITLNPTADFEYETGYYVQIDATAFDDVAGNSYAGIANTSTWDFTTAILPVESSRSSSGSSASVRVRNLLETGNTQLAQELISQYPGAFPNQIVDQVTNEPATTQINNTTCPLGTITRTLRAGSEGEDVRLLQKFLNCAGFTLSVTGKGSPGNETTLFSVKTYNSLAKFQEKYASEILTPFNLTKGTGIFGELSKKKAEKFTSI